MRKLLATMYSSDLEVYTAHAHAEVDRPGPIRQQYTVVLEPPLGRLRLEPVEYVGPNLYDSLVDAFFEIAGVERHLTIVRREHPCIICRGMTALRLPDGNPMHARCFENDRSTSFTFGGVAVVSKPPY